MCACALLMNGTNYKKIVPRLSGRQLRIEHKYIKTDFEYLFKFYFILFYCVDSGREFVLACSPHSSSGHTRNNRNDWLPRGNDGQHFMTLWRLLVDICARMAFIELSNANARIHIWLCLPKNWQNRIWTFLVVPTTGTDTFTSHTTHTEIMYEKPFQS